MFEKRAPNSVKFTLELTPGTKHAVNIPPFLENLRGCLFFQPKPIEFRFRGGAPRQRELWNPKTEKGSGKLFCKKVEERRRPTEIKCSNFAGATSSSRTKGKDKLPMYSWSILRSQPRSSVKWGRKLLIERDRVYFEEVCCALLVSGPLAEKTLRLSLVGKKTLVAWQRRVIGRGMKIEEREIDGFCPSSSAWQGEKQKWQKRRFTKRTQVEKHRFLLASLLVQFSSGN